MKTLVLVMMFAFIACQKQEVPQVTEAGVQAEMVKAEEDCDTKAKEAQKVEVTADSISLSNGSTGCTLDEAQK